jgi:hypothetical protein
MKKILIIPIQFPKELKYEILSYDKRFVIRSGELLTILPISRKDKRYSMLKEIPEKQIYPWWTCVELWLSYDKSCDADNYYVIRYEIVEEDNCYIYTFDKKWVLRNKNKQYFYYSNLKNEIIIY